MPGCHEPSICKTEQHNIHKVAENFPNLEKETGLQVQETQSPKEDPPKENQVSGWHACVTR